MLIEYDPVKHRCNRDKHDLSLAQAGMMDWASALIRVDSRFDYNEVRYQALGLLALRVHLAIFTIRDEALRMISLRRANRREERRHEEFRAAKKPASR